MIRVKMESISLQDIEDAIYSSSFMNDRDEIKIDGRDYVKIGKNKWQYMPSQAHAIGGIYTDKEIYDMASKTNDLFYDFNHYDEDEY